MFRVDALYARLRPLKPLGVHLEQLSSLFDVHFCAAGFTILKQMIQRAREAATTAAPSTTSSSSAASLRQQQDVSGAAPDQDVSGSSGNSRQQQQQLLQQLRALELQVRCNWHKPLPNFSDSRALLHACCVCVTKVLLVL